MRERIAEGLVALIERPGYVGSMGVSMDPGFRNFGRLQPDVEAILQRIGKDTWDCVLIDPDGNWTRGVFPSKEAAQAACEDLEIPWHEDWEDPRMARRMARRDHWGVPGGQRRAL
ncbi:MAG: hypothetical protein ACRDH9_02535 [Actinomycetota bacterium]